MAKGDFLIEIDEGSMRSVKRVEKLLEDFGDKIAPAVARAINRAVDGIGTDATRAITDNYGLKSREVRDLFRVSKYAAEQSLRATVSARGNVLSLFRFDPKPSVNTTNAKDVKSRRRRVSDGVSVRVRERHTLPGTFVSTMDSGHKGIFVRRDDRTIYELFGPSVPQMMNRLMEADDDLLERGLDERFDKRLDHEVLRALDKELK